MNGFSSKTKIRLLLVYFVVVLVTLLVGCGDKSVSEDVTASLVKAAAYAEVGDLEGMAEVFEAGNMYSFEDDKIIGNEMKTITLICFMNCAKNHLEKENIEALNVVYHCWKACLDIIKVKGSSEEYQDFAKFSLIVARASSDYGLQRETIGMIDCYRTYAEKSDLELDEEEIEKIEKEIGEILRNAGKKGVGYLI